MSVTVLLYRMMRLGWNVSFDWPFHSYCLWQKVGTELTGWSWIFSWVSPHSFKQDWLTVLTNHDVSESQQNLILSQAHFRTFLKYYLSQHIVMNVQAVFLGQNFMLNMIKEIEKLCLHQDPKLPKHLTDSQQILVHQHPKIISAEQVKIVLQKQIRLGTEYQCLCSQIWAIKLWEECVALAMTLHNFHSTVNLNHMVTQLKKKKSASQILVLIKHVIVNHNWLTANLFLLVTDESFINIVKSMSHLCLQTEGKGQQNSIATKHNNNSLIQSNSVCDDLVKSLSDFDTNIPPTQSFIKAAEPEQCGQATTAITETVIPPSLPPMKKWLTTCTCLFCFENLQCSHAQRFPITTSLCNHYCMIHFQYQIDTFSCPIPACDKIILDLNHFANHAVTIHKSDLRVRTFIMKIQERSVKPGTLITFRLWHVSKVSLKELGHTQCAGWDDYGEWCS